MLTDTISQTMSTRPGLCHYRVICLVMRIISCVKLCQTLSVFMGAPQQRLSSSSSSIGGKGSQSLGAFKFDSDTTSIGLETPYHEYDYRQFDATEVMYGMRDNNRGETVTLMEGLGPSNSGIPPIV